MELSKPGNHEPRLPVAQQVLRVAVQHEVVGHVVGGLQQVVRWSPTEGVRGRVLHHPRDVVRLPVPVDGRPLRHVPVHVQKDLPQPHELRVVGVRVVVTEDDRRVPETHERVLHHLRPFLRVRPSLEVHVTRDVNQFVHVPD